MYIVRYQPGVLPSITLGIVVGGVYTLEWIEWLVETTIATTSTHKQSLAIEIMLIATTAVVEVLVIGLLTQQLSYLGDTVVSQCILQALSHRLESRILIVRQIAILFEQIHTALIKHSRCLHRIKGSLLIGYKTFQNHIGQHSCTGVTHHTVGLVTHQVPYRQLALLLKDVQEGGSHILLLLRMNQRHQRMSCTIGIPEREGGIVGKVAMMHLTIGTTVVACNIAEYRWCSHGVIKGCIEDGTNGLIVGIYINLTQLVVPCLISSSYGSLEIPTWQLGLEVSLGILDTYCRDGTFYHHWL